MPKAPKGKEASKFVEQKTKLEIENLKIDAEQKTDSWWKRPAYLSIFAPILVAAATFLYNYWNGAYDFDRQIKEAELKIANAKIEELAAKKYINALEIKYCKIFDDINFLDEIYNNRLTFQKIKRMTSDMGTALFIYEQSESKQNVIVRFSKIHQELTEMNQTGRKNQLLVEDLHRDPKKFAAEKLQAYADACKD